MREAENMREIAALKPNFFGLIFVKKSPRFVSLEQAKQLPQFSEIKRIGVFVNENLEMLRQLSEKPICLSFSFTAANCRNIAMN